MPAERNHTPHSTTAGLRSNAENQPCDSGRKSSKFQGIVLQNGSWWLVDPVNGRTVRLEPLFEACGWNVGKLGDALGFGKRTFSRMVEQSLGINCKAWLRNMRIVAACHLLREGTKIETTARRLGFRHHSDFTREFRSMIGVPPSFYMKAERSRSTAAWELG